MKISEKQERVLEAVAAGGHVALYGAAGTGKSVLRDEIVKRHASILLGPTGMSIASTSSGMTVARFLGCNGSTSGDAGAITSAFKRSFKSLDGRKLVIDEVSMVSLTDFVALDYSLRKALQNNKVFGGLDVVLIGDIFQLQPVEGETFFFETDAYKALETKGIAVFQLETVFRQNDTDAEDAAIMRQLLSEARRGYLSGNSANFLMGVLNLQTPRKGAVRLAGTRRETDTFNHKKLDEMEGEVVRLGASLRVKVGAKVIFTRNIYDKTKKGLVRPNGALGVIRSVPETDIATVTEDSPAIEVVSEGQTYSVTPLRDLESSAGDSYQYPLDLAWSLTIHKTQGQTMDKVHVDGTSISEAGQAYVAISRVRKLSDLSVSNLEPCSFEIPRTPAWCEYRHRYDLQ